MVCAPLVGTSGRVSAYVTKPCGRRRVIFEDSPNLITDPGLERMAAFPVISHCSVGGSAQAPGYTDTDLALYYRTHTSISSTLYGACAVPPYYGWMQVTFVFAPPTEDLTVAEIGIGWAAGGTGLWSRSLTRDLSGITAPFPWAADEELTVVYEVRKYAFNEAQYSDQGCLYIVRPALVTDVSSWRFYNGGQEIGRTPGVPTIYPPTLYAGELGGPAETPSGLSYSPGAVAWTNRYPYVDGSQKRVGAHTYSRHAGHLSGGVRSILVLSTVGAYQVSVDPPIQRSSSQYLSLTVETPKWGRAPA
jgi:hypothetical protein